MTQKTWLLVANASTARIFCAEGKEKLSPIEEFSHQESRQSGIEFNTDRPGRTSERGGVTRHGLEETTSPKQVEAQRFARELANYLESARKHGNFERVYLAASPAFLGLLRGCLTDQTSSMVVESISKDLTAIEPSQIHKHVYLTFGT